MRVVFVGASPMAVLAARELLDAGHEVVVIEADPEKVTQLAEELDCGLIEADGSRPNTLQEVGPEQTDFLFCLSNRDEANILAALVGQSLGFGRVVAKIEDPSLEPICTSLGLQDTIVPDREVARGLCGMVEGYENPDLSTVVRSGLRFFSFEVFEGSDGTVHDLDLPEQARVIARSRGEASVLADRETAIEAGDELVVLAADSALEELQERYGERGRGESGDAGD